MIVAIWRELLSGQSSNLENDLSLCEKLKFDLDIRLRECLCAAQLFTGVLILDTALLPLKANLGCGFDIREGYLNVDLHDWHKPDLIADVTNLDMLPDGHFNEILAQDILEHLERHKTVPTLKEWARIMRPGGVIHIRVPSLLDLFSMLSSPERRSLEESEKVIHLIHGTQAYTGDYHLAGFTPVVLEAYLKQAGLLLCHAHLRDEWLFEVSARKIDNLIDPEEMVHNSYFRILHRPADSGGLAALAARVEQENITVSAVDEILANSEEAKRIESMPLHMRNFHAQPLPEPQKDTNLIKLVKKAMGRK